MRPGDEPDNTEKAGQHTASVIGWTALSILLPGVAHLRAGRRRTGLILLGAFAGVVLGLVVAAFLGGTALLAVALRGSWLSVLLGVAVVGALAWFALVLRSYVILGPDRLSPTGQIVSGIAIGVLAILVMAPFALAARNIASAQDAINAVFKAPPSQKVDHDDPWNGRERVNYLLLGSDSARGRDGVRTDTMIVVSVNVKNGNAVLLSLPRNLENVRFPEGSPMHRQFPDGYQASPAGNDQLLNSVWSFAEDNPQLFGDSPKESKEKARQRGADVLKETISHTLGLEIDNYAMVDMWGFAKLIDAIGGLEVKVERDIVYGRYNEGRIKKGTRRLSGEQVQWYARSRTFSTDYDRMNRQRCVLNGILKQADPGTLLTNFDRIAATAKRMFRTDIPRDMLEHLAALSLKSKNAKITSVSFTPPLINTGYPNWKKIRRLTREAIAESDHPAPPQPASTPTPDGPKKRKDKKVKDREGKEKPPANDGPSNIDEVCEF